MSQSESGSPHISAQLVEQIMSRAELALGRSCHYGPCMKELQRCRPDGWCSVGCICELESERAWKVWWHKGKEEGKLTPFHRLADGRVVPGRFRE